MEALAGAAPRPERAPGALLRRTATDERLVAAIRGGSEEAFAVVFDRYHRQILSFCRHMLGSREESEDAVQATFLSAYRDLMRSNKPMQLRPWLYAIARNHCLSILRARRESASLDDVEPAVEGLGVEVERRADLRDMLVDVARLPDDQRAALVLSEIGALSHAEVARILDCPKDKVKALVFQARSSLAASREARDTPCAEIREELAAASGAALRRRTLRRHLRECEGCRAFQAEVKRQRAAMALLLPVVPTAGLRLGVLNGVRAGGAAGLGGTAAAGGGGGGAVIAGGGTATGGVGAVLGTGAAKVLVAAALLGGGAGLAAVESGGGARHGTTAQPASTRGAAKNGSGASTGTVPAGFAPTRAHGEQALGGQGQGVANGLVNPKGTHGHSGTAPGRTGTSPGLAGTSPGLAGTSPGKAGTSPGKAGTTPGQTGTHHTATPKSGTTTHGGGTGGNADHVQGNGGDHGQSGTATGGGGTSQGMGLGVTGTLPADGRAVARGH
jgi:RNA polymerase sigma factor (sigma-70 family)